MTAAPNATFDASTLNFEGGAQGQSKSVTATLTVTDETGKTATQTTTITVNCQPTFVRLDDVIFAKNNTRVNNCGKRVLIDDAAPEWPAATTTSFSSAIAIPTKRRMLRGSSRRRRPEPQRLRCAR